MYNSFVHPALVRNEGVIDDKLAQIKSVAKARGASVVQRMMIQFQQMVSEIVLKVCVCLCVMDVILTIDVSPW